MNWMGKILILQNALPGLHKNGKKGSKMESVLGDLNPNITVEDIQNGM